MSLIELDRQNYVNSDCHTYLPLLAQYYPLEGLQNQLCNTIYHLTYQTAHQYSVSYHKQYNKSSQHGISKEETI